MDIRFEKLEKENAELKIENTKLKTELEQYKETEDAKMRHRKRMNILYTANVKKREPKESTIQKYDLKKDGRGKILLIVGRVVLATKCGKLLTIIYIYCTLRPNRFGVNTI